MRLIDADEFKRVAAGCVFETPKGIRIKAEIAIDARPAVDAEPVRHGQWREISAHIDYDGDILRDYECSECFGIIRDVPDVWQYENFHLDRYCAMCGAKMDGGGDHGKK